MIVIKAPEKLDWSGPSVFLAGSIEMGKAEDWQTRITNSLEGRNVTVFNPRRENWDPSWPQVKTHPQFREQVEWELTALGNASMVAMYFDPTTMSPISLLELGLMAHKEMLVCCPEGFWRKGNVDIVCEWYGITVVETIEELVSILRERFR